MQAGQWRMYELTSSRPEASRRCIAGNGMRNERIMRVVIMNKFHMWRNNRPSRELRMKMVEFANFDDGSRIYATYRRRGIPILNWAIAKMKSSNNDQRNGILLIIYSLKVHLLKNSFL